MLTAKYRDGNDIIDITKYVTPRKDIDKERLICKLCGGKVSIKHGLLVTKHFFHLSGCTNDFARHPESAEHNLGKELIASHVQKNWKEFSNVRVEFEYPFPEIKRIADVAMIFPSGWIVVHEIQLASITNEHLKKRTEDYNAVGADCFWWLGKSADSPANRTWCIDNYGYSLSLQRDVLEAKIKDLPSGES